MRAATRHSDRALDVLHRARLFLCVFFVKAVVSKRKMSNDDTNTKMPTDMMNMKDAFYKFYDEEDYDFFETDEKDEMRRLWNLEIKQRTGRRKLVNDDDYKLDPETAKAAIAFVMHGVKTYMISAGWKKIDRGNDMPLTYYTRTDLARMKKAGEVPELL